jgi:hypothetical protein
VQRAELRVDVDVRDVGVEVGADPLQPGQLAPPQPGVGIGDRHQPVVRRHPPGQRVHLVSGRVRTLRPVLETDPQLPTRVRPNQPLVHGLPENHREQHEDVLGALVGHVLAECLVHPPLHRDPRNLAHGGARPAGQDVVADVGVVGRPRDVSDPVRLGPLTDPLVDGGLGQTGVDEPAASLVGLHVGSAVVRLGLVGESGFPVPATSSVSRSMGVEGLGVGLVRP